MCGLHTGKQSENTAHSSRIQAQSKPFRIVVLTLTDLELERALHSVFHRQKPGPQQRKATHPSLQLITETGHELGCLGGFS